MKTSTEIRSSARLVGREKAIELISRAGFDAWDFSMLDLIVRDRANNAALAGSTPLNSDSYAKYAANLKRIGEDNGIICNQSHAPFPVSLKDVEGYLMRAIECTAIAGGEICIIHPNNDKPAEQNAEMYLRLLPFAKSCGVKIAAENMFNWDFEKDTALPAACSDHTDFLAHILAVNDPFLVACLDIGHAEMAGLNTSATQMINTLGRHVQALHVHDNDGRHDLHLMPFTQSIDYAPIVKSLKNVGYTGFLTLEAEMHLKACTAENVFDRIKELAASAKKLAEMYESC